MGFAWLPWPLGAGSTGAANAPIDKESWPKYEGLRVLAFGFPDPSAPIKPPPTNTHTPFSPL